jgi:hypothetical protein
MPENSCEISDTESLNISTMLSSGINLYVGADGPNRRKVKRMCVSECIVVVVQSVFYLRIK